MRYRMCYKGCGIRDVRYRMCYKGSGIRDVDKGCAIREVG